LLSEKLAGQLDDTVAHGPFRGLKLHKSSFWSGADRGSMLLGMYEQEVLLALETLSNSFDTFVDVGAADGYYAVGAITSGQFLQSICFESDPRGQQAIRSLGQLNGVESHVQIFGHAASDFLQQLASSKFNENAGAVVLLDIEGGEYSLLTDDLLGYLRNSALIIELHSSDVSLGSPNDELLKRGRQYFDYYFAISGARDPNLFPELAKWTDDDRWLLCSESRMFPMKWLILTPRTETSDTR
jgi:hypothetical protein